MIQTYTLLPFVYNTPGFLAVYFIALYLSLLYMHGPGHLYNCDLGINQWGLQAKKSSHYSSPPFTCTVLSPLCFLSFVLHRPITPTSVASQAINQHRNLSRGNMVPPASLEAGPSRSPPPKEYTPDIISTDPLTDAKEEDESEGFDTQTIRDSPPPPDVYPILQFIRNS